MKHLHDLLEALQPTALIAVGIALLIYVGDTESLSETAKILTAAGIGAFSPVAVRKLKGE